MCSRTHKVNGNEDWTLVLLLFHWLAELFGSAFMDKLKQQTNLKTKTSWTG